MFVHVILSCYTPAVINTTTARNFETVYDFSLKNRICIYVIIFLKTILIIAVVIRVSSVRCH